MKDHGGFEPRDRGWAVCVMWVPGDGSLFEHKPQARTARVQGCPPEGNDSRRLPARRLGNWSERDRHLRSAQPAATPNDTRKRRFLPGLQEP